MYRNCGIGAQIKNRLLYPASSFGLLQSITVDLEDFTRALNSWSTNAEVHKWFPHLFFFCICRESVSVSRGPISNANCFHKLLKKQVVFVKFFSHVPSVLGLCSQSSFLCFQIIHIYSSANGQPNKIAIVCVLINNLHNTSFWENFIFLCASVNCVS